MRPAERWHLAARGLSRRPVRTLLTLLGVVISVTSMILFLSLGQGLKGQFREELRSAGPDVQVARPAPLSLLPLPNLPRSVVAAVTANAAELGVTGVTPVVAQIKQALDPTQSAVYYGLPAREGLQALFPQVRVARGRLLQASDEGQAVAVLGAVAARNQQLGVGDEFMITRRARVRVIGVLEPQQTLTDTFTFLPLTGAQRALGLGDQLSFVALRLRDPERAPEVAAQLRRITHLDVRTREDVLWSFSALLGRADLLSLVLSLVSLGVGALGVANTMLMAVHERTREFGVLRAMGARPGFVGQLVIAEGLLLAVVGWSAGALLSMPGVWAINHLTQRVAGLDGAAFSPQLLGLSLGLSLLLGLLSGLWPAYRAGRTSIAEALGQC
ncbi:ABC transporter permease [Deinococcus radiotolerans]|uniref:ABC transporter permease n=1 Tax=Deinococcus radiotolerans TaxID=1309407 RepID=A0ABQ2FRN8_9DEIO|nr:ABC transporter permease [Deinococcus radiotolerans]GGL20139.1 ABC transporter permease [Deinococcus radiotolerans]